MFLQILPPENVVAKASTFDNDLLFVLLGLTFSVVVTLKITDLLSKIKIGKPSKKSNFLEDITLFSYIFFTK